MSNQDEFALSLLRGGHWFGKTVLLNRSAAELHDQPVTIISLTPDALVEVEFRDKARRLVPPGWLWLSIRDEYNPLFEEIKTLNAESVKDAPQRRSRRNGSRRA